MTVIQIALSRAMRLDGAIGAAVVDYVSRMALGTLSRRQDLDLVGAAYGGTDVVRANLAALKLVGREPQRLQDILITLDGEYHLIHPLTRRAHEGLFLLLILDRDSGDPDIARKELRSIATLL